MKRFLPALLAASCLAQSLPGTAPLPPEPQSGWSAHMVAGISRMADGLILASVAKRRPDRVKLAAVLGVSLRPGAPGRMAIYGEGPVKSFTLEVSPGISAEGLIHGSMKGPWALVLPDATVSVEQAVAAHPVPTGGTVVALQLISRGTEHSFDPRSGMRAQVSHREWVYRQSFVQGVSVPGIEVDFARAIIEWIAAGHSGSEITVVGTGEGGHLALFLAALDVRVSRAVLVGSFGPREVLWSEPIDRNLCGFLRDFGGAELATLVAPRPLIVIPRQLPNLVGRPTSFRSSLPSVTSPGDVAPVPVEQVKAESERALRLVPGEWLKVLPADAEPMKAAFGDVNDAPSAPAPDAARQARMVDALTRHLQARFDLNDARREASFWKRVPARPADYPAFVATQRQRFEEEVIGRLHDPDVPPRARSRLVTETDKAVIHEVMLDVWEGVPAWGWLAVPKEIRPGEKRPVVVCQHGLEGLPEDVFNDSKESAAYRPYQAFALRLAERGYVAFAPHNPYRGHDSFRVLQRKLQPLGLTLYSVINGQHRRILEWLSGLPEVDPARIAFYGLSYGGKSAMRTPAVLEGYCLSICSGDFNEWVRKVGSTSMPMSYVRTPEYEIPEWNLGGTFNYAEMAALIAPRPFMVERGHADGVGLDEWVDHEFAKVRRHYVRIGRPGDAVIEHFDGGHRINGVGTFEFLRRHLGR